MFFLARQSKNISNNIKILLCQRLYICSSYDLSVMIGFQLVNYQLLLEQFTLTYMYNANIMSELPFGRKTLHFCNLQHCKTSLQHYKVIPHYHVSSITKKIEKYINIHKIKNEEHINFVLQIKILKFPPVVHLCFQALQCLSPLWREETWL